MKFSYKLLQSFFNKKLPQPEKMANLLTMKSFEVSEVKKTKKDWVFNIDVLPNRAFDCFSHFGVAREISAITGYKYRFPHYKVKENNSLKINDLCSVEIKESNSCSRYMARFIVDVKVGSSPQWLKDYLESCGLRSINNIVDIANYVMLETGQPLHAFDADKIENKKIIVRFAKDKEKVIALDDKEYELNKNILVIADNKKILGIAGIKGGKEAEISFATKRIILESANFNSQIIRKGSQMVNLKTDASLRFEHGFSPVLTELAINRASFLIQKIAGGKVAKGIIDFYPKVDKPLKIRLELLFVQKTLGNNLPSKLIFSILKNLGFKIISAEKDIIDVEVPLFRLDIKNREDLVEEIGRIYGYENLEPVMPKTLINLPEKNLNIFWEDFVKDILRSIGFIETYNYSFISDKDAQIFGYKNSKNGSSGQLKESKLIEILNPVSEEFKYLRPVLLVNLLKNVARNKRNFSQIKIFEIGNVFINPNKEKKMFSGLIIGESFYELKGVIDLVFEKLGIVDLWYDEYQAKPEDYFYFWEKERCAEIKINNQKVGFLGEISFSALQKLKIKDKIVAFDIDFDKLVQLASQEHEYRPLSRFPEAIRDIAVLVPLYTKVEEVLNGIEEVKTDLIRDIKLFDIYEGEEIPEGKKNLAFHIVYQAKDHTLTSEEINQVQDKIIKALQKNPLWQVRK